MKTLFALLAGAVMGTIAALWLAARGERGGASQLPAAAGASATSVTPSGATVSEEAPE